MPKPRSRVEAACPICGRAFRAYPSEIKRGAGRYCGYNCAMEAARRRVKAIAEPEQPRTPAVARTCETCLKTFLVYPYRASPGAPRITSMRRAITPG